MMPVVVILIWLALGWAAGALYLSRRGKVVARAVSTCPACGGNTAVTADVCNSRLVVKCRNDACGDISYRPVRASALSLFNVSVLMLALVAGILGYELGGVLGFGPLGSILAALLGAVLGGAVVRLAVRGMVFSLLRSNLPPAWQEEVVAYLAPPPWRMRG